MKKVLLLLLLLAPSLMLAKNDFTVRDFIQSCTSQSLLEQRMCIIYLSGYLYGFKDGALLDRVAQALAKNSDKELSNKEIKNLVIESILDNPLTNSKSSIPLITINAQSYDEDLLYLGKLCSAYISDKIKNLPNTETKKIMHTDMKFYMYNCLEKIEGFTDLNENTIGKTKNYLNGTFRETIHPISSEKIQK